MDRHNQELVRINANGIPILENIPVEKTKVEIEKIISIKEGKIVLDDDCEKDCE